MRRLDFILLFLTSFLLASCPARATEVEELSIGYKNFNALNPHGRDALIYPEPPKEGLELNLKTLSLGFIYADARVHGTTTDAQYRAVGLEARTGARVTQSLELGLYHHSQHVLDRAPATMPRFPVEDALELRFVLIGPKRDALIP